MYKLFDYTLEGSVTLIEFINGCRTKMTGLDQNNMNLIENSFKRAFRNLDESGKFNNVFEEKVEPKIFAKVCISVMWFMKVYLWFKERDPVKVNKITLKCLQESVLYYMIEGEDVVEKMSKFD